MAQVNPATMEIQSPAVESQFQQPTFAGQPLNEFLAGGIQTDAQGRMIDPTVDRSAFEAASAARSAAAGPNLQSIAGAPRPGVDVLSLAMQRSRMEAGLDPVAGAPTGMSQQQQRDQLERGIDPATGQRIGGELTFEQRMKTKEFELAEKKFMADLMKTANAVAPMTPAQKKFAEEAGKGAFTWDQGGRQNAQENIQKFGSVIADLESGQIDTRTLTEFVPIGGDWWRSAVNPTGQQALDNIRGVIFQGLRETLGAQFTEREGERLVNASYNPKLSEAENIARLKPALQRMQATFQAKENLTQHIMNGGDPRDYKGKTPRQVYDSFDQQASGGSPIEGDVNVASAADDILAQQ